MGFEKFSGDIIIQYSYDLGSSKLDLSANFALNGAGEILVDTSVSDIYLLSGLNDLTKVFADPFGNVDSDFNANLKKGKVWVAATAAFGEKKNVAVRTPTAVAAIRGTKYRAKAGEDESSVLVYDGKVDVNAAKNVIDARNQQMRQGGPQGGAAPKFTLGPVTEIQAPTQVAGPYEVSLEDWISLVEGMQINVRKDGKYSMFKFDQDTDAGLDFVKWNKEQDAKDGN